MFRKLSLPIIAALASVTDNIEAQTPKDFKIAFIGDSSLENEEDRQSARKVLQLVRREASAAVVHGGDLTYTEDDSSEDGPMLLEHLVNTELGEGFPFFIVVGNHDAAEWPGFQKLYAARMKRLGIHNSEGENQLGFRASFTYQGILFLATAPRVGELKKVAGTWPVDPSYHSSFIRVRAQESQHIWRISSWHRNMTKMQLGRKGCHPISHIELPCISNRSDQSGWGVYEESRKAGAIIATAHEHSYSRTHPLRRIEDQRVALDQESWDPDGIPTLTLRDDNPQSTADDEGVTFVFVSGLAGGKDVRPHKRFGDGAWWASKYTSHDGEQPGALFGVFNYADDPRLARFYFKTVEDVLVDEFYLRSMVGNGHELNVETRGAGSVRLQPPGGKYRAGQTVTLIAESHPFGRFEHWSGDASGTSTKTSVVMSSERKVVAVFLMPNQVVIPLSADEDDAEEHEDGTVKLSDRDDLDFETGRWVGIRFKNVPLPRDARVSSARVQFFVEDPKATKTEVRIYGDAQGHAAQFEEHSRNISSRARTDGVSWDVPLWTTDPGKGDTGWRSLAFHRTPDLTRILDAVVRKPDWKEGNAIALLFETVRGDRDALPFRGTTHRAPRLIIEFFP